MLNRTDIDGRAYLLKLGRQWRRALLHTLAAGKVRWIDLSATWAVSDWRQCRRALLRTFAAGKAHWTHGFERRHERGYESGAD